MVTEDAPDDTTATLGAVSGDTSPQEWTVTDDGIAELADDHPATLSEALVLYDQTQSEWDRRQVHQLKQIEAVFLYWASHWQHSNDELAHRGAVILRAGKHAPDVERVYGVRLDPAGVGAYLELTAGTENTVAATPVPVRKRPAPRRKTARKTTGSTS
jgi:hypothetical protein